MPCIPRRIKHMHRLIQRCSVPVIRVDRKTLSCIRVVTKNELEVYRIIVVRSGLSEVCEVTIRQCDVQTTALRNLRIPTRIANDPIARSRSKGTRDIEVTRLQY